MIEDVTSLRRSSQPRGSVEDLRSRAAVLEDTLAGRLKENARAHADFEAFRIRYRQEVGALYEELEELEREIAEAELGEMAQRLEKEAASRTPSTGHGGSGQRAAIYDGRDSPPLSRRREDDPSRSRAR